MAATDLTTLPNVKAWLQVNGTSDDALLTRLITATSDYITQWLNRQLLSGPVTDVRNGDGGRRMFLSEYPVTAVSSVTVGAISIPASTGYGSAGYLFDDRGVTLTGYRFDRDIKNVTINYTAGYATVPLELEQACIELISLRYRERDRIGHTSKSIQGETTAFMVKDMPPSVLTILNNYKKVVPL